jgi:hypothetical protein
MRTHPAASHPTYERSRLTHGCLILLAALVVAGCGPSSENAPRITSMSPRETATGVALNTRLSVTFDGAMAPLSASTFTLKGGTTPITGAVATSADGRTATFTPSSNLVASTVYTATVNNGAKSAGGASFATDHAWTFTTGPTADMTAPRVSTTSPVADSTGAALNTKVVATFTEAMDPLSITGASFTLQQNGAPVPGNVTWGPGTTATFTPANTLAANAAVIAKLSTDVRDLNGNPLAAPVSWSFTTGTVTAKGPAPVSLGTAGNYAVLAKSAISTVPASSVTGDIGLGPAAASYITGFDLVADATNVFSTSPQVVGKVYAADYAVPTPEYLTTAVSNMESAYTDAGSRPTPDFLELGTGNIGGLTLVPGLYKWTSSVTLPADVTLSGGANDVWIFQTTGDLVMSSAKRVVLSGGAQAKNVFWQVAGQATLGTGAHFEGIILCKTDVTLQTGATMNGRILSQTQVALQQATVTQPAQ